MDDGTYNIDAKAHGSNIVESPTTQPKTSHDPSLLPTLALKKKFVAYEPLKTRTRRLATHGDSKHVSPPVRFNEERYFRGMTDREMEYEWMITFPTGRGMLDSESGTLFCLPPHLLAPALV